MMLDASDSSDDEAPDDDAAGELTSRSGSSFMTGVDVSLRDPQSVSQGRKIFSLAHGIRVILVDLNLGGDKKKRKNRKIQALLIAQKTRVRALCK